MSSIPASYSVAAKPSVISGGAGTLNLSGLCLTPSTRVPIGTVLSFPNGDAVEEFFGAASNENVIAQGGQTLGGNPAGTGYFGGSTVATAIPGALLFAQYNQTAVSAWLRGGNASALSLAQLQAISGTLDVLIDGVAHNGSPNLSSATSFSSAAGIIQTAINGSLANLATSTASTIAAENFAVTASIAGNIMYVTAVGSGTIVNGAAISGTGVTAAVVEGQISGTPGGIGEYAVSVSQSVPAGTTVDGTYGLFTLGGTISGTFAVGQTLTGGSVDAGTIITQLLSGTGGADGNTFAVNLTQTQASAALDATGTPAVVTYDSVSGGFLITSGLTGAPSSVAFATGSIAASLFLTSATGATLSQGAAAAVPAVFMTNLLNQTIDWATFFLSFDPDGGNGNTQKIAFAEWTNSVAPAYLFIDHDSDITPTESVPATSSQGYIINTLDELEGTALIYEPTDLNHAAFVSGAIASIDFTAVGGRTSLAYRTQPGLGAAVTSGTVAANLAGSPTVEGSFGNGYNFVGFFSLPGQTSINLQRGTVSGAYQWIDSYINQIWLTNQFVSASYNYLLAVKSFPYTAAGYANYELAMSGVIQAGLTFGMYAGGVTLSQAEIVEVNTAAGANITPSLQSQGYYFQILDPGSTARQSRMTPKVTFWYVDDGSVQSLVINPVAVS